MSRWQYGAKRSRRLCCRRAIPKSSEKRRPSIGWGWIINRPQLNVFGPAGVIWRAENVNLTKIAYPTSPALAARISIRLGLEKEFPASRRLSNFPAAEALAIQDQLAELTSLGGLSKTTLAVLKANFLMSRDLFHEAREILLEGTAADPDEPTLHFVLGELYDKIGLRSLATEEYGAAEFLAKSSPSFPHSGIFRLASLRRSRTALRVKGRGRLAKAKRILRDEWRFALTRD